MEQPVYVFWNILSYVREFWRWVCISYLSLSRLCWIADVALFYLECGSSERWLSVTDNVLGGEDDKL